MFFDGLGIHHPQRPFPGSGLFFEFYRSATSGPVGIYVKMYYFSGDTRKEKIIRFPSQKADLITVENFMYNIEARLAQANFYNLDEKCQQTNDLNPNPNEFYKGD